MDTASPTWMQRQIAVLTYSSKDCGDSTDLAGDFGTALVSRRCAAVFLGSAQPLPRFFEALKNLGGRSFLLHFDNSRPSSWLFDAVLSVKNYEEALRLAIASCAGIIAIPSCAAPAWPARGLDEIPIPVAFLMDKKSGEPCVVAKARPDACANNLGFSDPKDALSWIQSECANTHSLCAAVLLENAVDIHQRSYPLGEEGAYLRAAELFHAAALSCAGSDADLRRRAEALFFDALGDHAYYHERDFLGAASFYEQGRRKLGATVDPTCQEGVETFLFLKAVTIESIALAFVNAGEVALARSIVLEAVKRYRQAGFFASSQTFSCYQHTVIGLMGLADLLQARQELGNGNIAMAETLLATAKQENNEALQHQPLWATSGFSDNYANTLAQVKDVEQQIALAKR